VSDKIPDDVRLNVNLNEVWAFASEMERRSSDLQKIIEECQEIIAKLWPEDKHE